jgi:chromosome segregation ATPase
MTAFLAIGCRNSKMKDDLAVANASVHERDSLLTDSQNQNLADRRQLQSQIQDSEEKLAAAENKCEKLATSLRSSQAEMRELQDHLSIATAQYNDTLDSLSSLLAAMQQGLNACESNLQESQTRWDASQALTDNLIQTRDSLYAFVDDVRPWLAYYRKESHRNWLKKLFGAGRAKKPESEELSFEAQAQDTNPKVRP